MGEDDEAGQLAGKVAAVTGATSGSGRAIAKRFAAAGAQVVLLARAADRLKEMEADLGEHVTGISTDVGNAESVRTTFAEIEQRFGKLDILINNAGIHLSCPFDKMPESAIAEIVTTNLIGPMYTCRAAIPLMRAAGGGDIVNTSSESTIDIFPYMASYAGSKAGLEGFGRTLAFELVEDEIRVTTFVQGVALGEGGGSTNWDIGMEHAADTFPRLQEEGTVRRVMGLHGGMNVDDVADAHLFVVTRPRGQKIDVIRVRGY